MLEVIKTLFLPVQGICHNLKNPRILFINACYHPILHEFSSDLLTLQQHFFPYAAELGANDFMVEPAIKYEATQYDIVLILAPKNIEELQFNIAHALRVLKAGGIIICAGSNKSGGTRLKGLFESYGVSNILQESKNKARVVYGRCYNPNVHKISEAIVKYSPQRHSKTGFVTQPGLFSWANVDKGSEILSRYISFDLFGKGADFGCGYGYLSHFVLKNCQRVQELVCIDADHRALECCSKNIQNFNVPKHFIWTDLFYLQSNLSDLDFIIMNPPFHEGTKTDIRIGQAFIRNASNALRSKGQLLLVANRGLGYESILENTFKNYTKPFEGEGYKIFMAVK